jgi:hypothetical protein
MLTQYEARNLTVRLGRYRSLLMMVADVRAHRTIVEIIKEIERQLSEPED